MEQIISGDKASMPMTERFYSVNGQMMGYESGGVKKDFLTDHLGSITAEIYWDRMWLWLGRKLRLP
jgi:hypothetical protein